MQIKNNKLNASTIKKIIFGLLLLIFLTHLLFRIYSYRERYLSTFNPGQWKDRYLKSQWVDPLSKNPIGDDGLYTFAAWEYIHGFDPTLINPEMPFFGKYLLGFTIIVFNNENIFALITGLTALGVFFIFNREVIKNNLVAFLPVIILSFDKLFYEQLRAPFFDTLQLTFLLLVFTFFLRNKFILSLIFLGLFAGTKFPFMVILPLLTCILALLFTYKHKQILYYISGLPIVFIVYMLSYLQFFLLGNSFMKFLSVQKYILNFYMIGAKTPFFGTVFPMIFSGTWYTHFKTRLRVEEWNILWPISFFMSFVSLKIHHRFKLANVVLVLWVIVYLLFLSITPVFPRYLLLLLPFLYTITIWVLSKNILSKLL